MQLGTRRGRAVCEATPELAQTPQIAAGTMNTEENCQNQHPVPRGTERQHTKEILNSTPSSS